MDYIFDYIYTLLLIGLFYYLYNKTPQYNYIKKDIFFILIITNIISLYNLIFNIQFTFKFVIIFIFFLKKLLNHIKYNKVKSSSLNKKNVFYIVYKPKGYYTSLKAMLGFPVASSGIIIYENNKYYVFQYRLDCEYYQKIELELNKLDRFARKYIIIDTGFKTKDLKDGWQEKMLKRKRVTGRGFWKFNCLLTAKIVLDQIPRFKTKKYEFLTSIYSKRMLNNFITINTIICDGKETL